MLENRNILVRGSNKSRVGKCNLGSMEEGRDFGPLTMYLVVKKAHTATTKLMFYVMGSSPILQAI